MAKYKETPCEYYICFNECEKVEKQSILDTARNVVFISHDAEKIM